MRKQWKAIAVTVVASALGSYSVYAAADDRVEGKVVRTELTACDFASHRCQGYVTLEQASMGGEGVKIRVAGETRIMKGADQVYLPTLKGNLVSVSYVAEKGEKLATAITVLPAKKP